MRLLAYYPLSSYSRWQRYPSCQQLVSDASSSHQKLAPYCIQQWQIQIQSKRAWNYRTTQEDLHTLSNKCISPWLEVQKRHRERRSLTSLLYQICSSSDFSEVMPQSSFTLMIIFCHGTTILSTWFICIHDSAASRSNLKMCSGSKPRTLGQEALVPKILDVHHVCETILWNTILNKVWLFFVWKVRNRFMNSVNIWIHVLIEFTYL